MFAAFLASWWFWLVLAYLAGSIPFGLLIGQAKGIDIRQHGSGNVGATNCGRVLGKKWGVLCFGLDVLKGLAPVLAAGLTLSYVHTDELAPTQSLRWLLIGAAAVVGHVFPIWLKGRGGKGVATSLGVLLGIWPTLTLPGIGALATWLIVLQLFGYVSLASVVAAVLLPLMLVALAMIDGHDLANLWPFYVVTGVLSLLVVIRHLGNIRRLLAGTEPRSSLAVRFGRRSAE